MAWHITVSARLLAGTASLLSRDLPEEVAHWSDDVHQFVALHRSVIGWTPAPLRACLEHCHPVRVPGPKQHQFADLRHRPGRGEHHLIGAHAGAPAAHPPSDEVRRRGGDPLVTVTAHHHGQTWSDLTLPWGHELPGRVSRQVPDPQQRIHMPLGGAVGTPAHSFTDLAKGRASSVGEPEGGHEPVDLEVLVGDGWLHPAPRHRQTVPDDATNICSMLPDSGIRSVSTRPGAAGRQVTR